MTTPGRNFIILSYGRTGSTYLCHALDAHPEVLARNEVFHPAPASRAALNGRTWANGEDSWAFVAANLFDAPDRPVDPPVACGFKLFYFHAREPGPERTIWDRVASDPELRLVLLHRRNILAGYISEQRARASRVWHPRRDSSYGALQDVTIDPRAAQNYIAKVEEFEAFGRSLLPGRQALEVFYEDFAEDAGGTCERIAELLGVAPGHPWPAFEKGSADHHSTRIVNLAEVRDEIGGSRLGWMLAPYLGG